MLGDINIVLEYLKNKIIMDDKCKDCPFNDTGCPGGAWCDQED